MIIDLSKHSLIFNSSSGNGPILYITITVLLSIVKCSKCNFRFVANMLMLLRITGDSIGKCKRVCGCGCCIILYYYLYY